MQTRINTQLAQESFRMEDTLLLLLEGTVSRWERSRDARRGRDLVDLFSALRSSQNEVWCDDGVGCYCLTFTDAGKLE